MPNSATVGYTSAHGHSTLEPSATSVSYLVPTTFKSFNHHGQEDLTSEDGYDDEDDDMGDLSDSPSSHTSYSRPTTPSGTHPAPHVRTRASSSPSSDLPFTLAHKAERILGLTPGTLPYARAALDNARVEVRCSNEDKPPLQAYTPPLPVGTATGAGGSGMKGRMDRARKAMSVVLPGSKVANVVVGAGGKEEERRREKRRRAADGVIYWQNEVARLEKEESESKDIAANTVGRKRR